MAIYSETEIQQAAKDDPVIWQAYNLRTEKGAKLDFIDHVFQKDIVADMHPEQCVIKGSQIGLTTITIGKVLYLAANYSPTIIYTFPTATDVNQFSSARFKPMIESSPLLKRLMSGQLDNNQVKRIGNSFIYFRGTKKESQAISVPSDVNVHDELDFSDPTVKDTFASRLQSADSWKYTWTFSTPTLPDFGIDAEYKHSDQRRWFVKCDSCNKWQQVSFFKNIFTKRYKTSVIRYWGCRKCGAKLDRRKGHWVKKFDRKTVHGYFVSPTICNWITPKYLLRLKRRLNKKTFFNFHLGLAYSSGAASLDRELLLKCSVDGNVPNTADGCYMGVDQGDTLHVEVCRDYDGKRQVIYYGTVKSFDDLDAFMRKYGVICCVIDALPNKHSAKAFAARWPNRVKLAYYHDIKEEKRSQENAKKEGKDWADAKEPGTITLDRSETLDNSAEQWVNGEAFILKPDDTIIRERDFDNTKGNTGWIQQMCNMKRDMEENEKTAEKKVIWVKTGPDHYRHADNYAYISWKMYQYVGKDESMSGGRPSTLVTDSPLDRPSYLSFDEDGGIFRGDIEYDTDIMSAEGFFGFEEEDL